LERAALGIEEHGLAARVKLELDTLLVLPLGRDMERDAEPVAAVRAGSRVSWLSPTVLS